MKTQRFLSGLAFVLTLSLMSVGCDNSSNNGTTDAERFLGTWAITAAADQGGDRDVTQIFSALGNLSVSLKDDQTYLLHLEYADGVTPDLDLTGNYAVNESESRLVLSIQLEGAPQVNLNMEYVFQSDTVVEFTVNSLTIGILLGDAGSLLEGDVILTAQKI